LASSMQAALLSVIAFSIEGGMGLSL